MNIEKQAQNGKKRRYQPAWHVITLLVIALLVFPRAVLADGGSGSYNVLLPVIVNGGSLGVGENPGTIRINFQAAGTVTPAGFVADTGLPFGARGSLNFGWEADTSEHARERNAPNSPSKPYDTLNHLQRNGEHTWEIALPNGQYQVHLVAGDPVYTDSVYKVIVEETLLVDGTPTANQRWVEGNGIIAVGDGRLTVRSGPGAVNNKVSFIEIIPLSSPAPTATPGPTAQPTSGPPTATPPPTSTVLPPAPPPGGRFSDLVILTTNVARYDKFELQFNVQTAAANPSLPYDPNPPAGLAGGTGVTVNVLFSPNSWATTYTQPAFQYQPYTLTARNNRDHLTPSGAPVWRVRFAPQTAGNWQYRLFVQDASGSAYYPELGQAGLPFSVGQTSSNLYRQRGFLQVSPTDSRYFAFQDGTPFFGQGFNDSFDSTTEVEAKLTTYEQYRMDFMRVWMSGDGINGSQWTSWASHHLPGDGYLPGVSLDIHNTYNGADVALRLDNANPCLYADFWQGGVPVQPNTGYSFSARFKVTGVTGPAASGAHGFVIKRGDWLGTTCDQAGTGTPLSTPVSGTTGWTTLEGTFTTASGQYWLDNLYLARQNATGGQVYIDEVRVWRTGDPAQVNLLREPNANAHLYFDPMSSAQWDAYIESAERHGVYLKLVIDEKNEWIRNHIDINTGQMTASSSNTNFYARPGTKVRWLEEAWYRYLIARWGYSTAIHSFELVNEGDPYNGNHHEAANAMGLYFDQHDPSQHMTTTSFWAAFPNVELWSSRTLTAVDYANIHAYISTGWGLNASFLDAAHTETNPAHIYSGNASARLPGNENYSTGIGPRGMVIQGRGEWIIRYYMKASGLTANCSFGSTGSMARVTWRIDGGTYAGGQQGVVPFNDEGKDFLCTSPGGTFGWTQFRSDRDRSGTLLPTSVRLILTDDLPHEFSLGIENKNGTGGTAWIDRVELVSPSGEVQGVIGEFDITAMDEDTAWYNRAYGEVWGAGSLVGADMPLVRGETGVDFVGNQDWNRDLNRDTAGIWLHNNIWAQVNAGAMYELMWWVRETIPQSIFYNYQTYQNFMAGIPLSNGSYREAGATTSHANLRAWGQRDDTHGRMHLWIQNTQHTWKRVINGPAITPIPGTVTLSSVANGTYRIEWWNTYAVTGAMFQAQTVTVSNGTLTLTLPYALADDVAVKIIKQ